MVTHLRLEGSGQKVSYHASKARQVEDQQIDGVRAVGEALVRFRATMDAAERELRREVAAHYNGAAYIGEGSAARSIVRREVRR